MTHEALELKPVNPRELLEKVFKLLHQDLPAERKRIKETSANATAQTAMRELAGTALDMVAELGELLAQTLWQLGSDLEESFVSLDVRMSALEEESTQFTKEDAEKFLTFLDATKAMCRQLMEAESVGQAQEVMRKHIAFAEELEALVRESTLVDDDDGGGDEKDDTPDVVPNAAN